MGAYIEFTILSNPCQSFLKAFFNFFIFFCKFFYTLYYTRAKRFLLSQYTHGLLAPIMSYQRTIKQSLSVLDRLCLFLIPSLRKLFVCEFRQAFVFYWKITQSYATARSHYVRFVAYQNFHFQRLMRFLVLCFHIFYSFCIFCGKIIHHFVVYVNHFTPLYGIFFIWKQQRW